MNTLTYTQKKIQAVLNEIKKVDKALDASSNPWSQAGLWKRRRQLNSLLIVVRG